MNIDILHFTEAQWNALNYDQRCILYEAQNEKNRLQKKCEEDCESVKLILIANGTARSTLLDAMQNKVMKEYDEEIKNLADTTYDAIVNEVQADHAHGLPADITAPVIYNPDNPDTSLELMERFRSVKAYYMKIEDPNLRYNLFLQDKALKKYLGEYRSTMGSYLRTFL